MKLALVSLLAASLAVTAAPDAQAAKAGPRVELLEAGSGSKSPLRLKPTEGDKITVTMVMDMSMSMSMAGQAMPPQAVPSMTFGMDLEVNEVTGDEFTYTMTYTRADLGESETLPPAAVAEMKKMVGGIVGTVGHSTMTTRGFVKDGSIVPSEGAAPELAEMMSGMENQLSQMAAPFPEEPVGVGAKWKVTTEIENQGVTGDQVTEYTLKERKGDAIALDIAVVQSAAPQTISTPQGDMKLNKLTGAGSGNIGFDLGVALPVDAKTDVKSDMSMETTMQDRKMAVDVTMDMTMTLRSEKKQ